MGRCAAPRPQAPFASAKEIAAQIAAEIEALPVQNTPNVRAVRRRYSRQLREAEPALILELARELCFTYGYRGVPLELIRYRQGAFQRMGAVELEEPGQGIDSWWSEGVDG